MRNSSRRRSPLRKSRLMKKSSRRSRRRSGSVKRVVKKSAPSSRKRRSSRRRISEGPSDYHHSFRDFFHSIPLATPSPIVLNNRHCGPSPVHVPGAYSKPELVKLAVANGYSIESAENASVNQLCRLLQQPNTVYQSDLNKKVCGPSPSIQFPNVYSKDELVRMAISKGHLPEVASRSTVSDLCSLLGLSGKSVLQPGTSQRGCLPKELGGYSREEMIQMAVHSGFKRSVASRATNEELCDFLHIPRMNLSSLSSVPAPLPTTAVPIRPEDLIDDPQTCPNYSTMGAEFCNGIKLRKDGSQACSFDVSTNKCIMKAAAKSIEPELEPVSSTAKLQSDLKLAEIVDRAMTKFDMHLFNLLKDKHPEWKVNLTLLQDAANGIRTQNIETFNKQFTEYAKDILKKINDVQTSNQGEAVSQLAMMDQLSNHLQLLDQWVQNFATKCVDEYEIRIKVDSTSGKKSAAAAPVSPQDVASSLAAEAAKKEKEIQAANVVKEQLEESKDEKAKEMVQKQEEKIDKLEEEKKEIEDKLHKIEDYYYQKLGQKIVIDRSTLQAGKDPKIKLKVTVYSKDETSYLNYFRLKEQLEKIEQEQKILQKSRSDKEALRKKMDTQPAVMDTAKYPQLVKDLGELTSTLTSLDKEILRIRGDMAGELKKLKGTTLDPEGGWAGKFGDQAKGKAAKGTQQMYDSLDQLYNSLGKSTPAGPPAIAAPPSVAKKEQKSISKAFMPDFSSLFK